MSLLLYSYYEYEEAITIYAITIEAMTIEKKNYTGHNYAGHNYAGHTVPFFGKVLTLATGVTFPASAA